MRVSDQVLSIGEGTTFDEDELPHFKPLYNIDRSYKDAVDRWINDSASATEKPIDIQISPFNNLGESWTESGLSQEIAIDACHSFITAKTMVNNVEKNEHLSIEQLGEDVAVNFRATDIKAFNIKPGGW